MFTKLFAKKSPAEWECVCRLVSIFSCTTDTGKEGGNVTGGGWKEVLGLPGPGHKHLTTTEQPKTVEAIDNPDELPEAPAMITPECFPTLDLYWEGGSIFDSAVGSHPASCNNPIYNLAAWALPADHGDAE